MIASIIRIVLFVSLAFGGYKLYPRFKPALQPILANPAILGAETIVPVINKVNDLLPDKIQIPLPADTATTAGGDQSANNNGQISGVTTTNTIVNNVVNEVKQKAAEAAEEQIDQVKKETGNAFCAALIETIKKQCGVP